MWGWSIFQSDENPYAWYSAGRLLLGLCTWLIGRKRRSNRSPCSLNNNVFLRLRRYRRSRCSGTMTTMMMMTMRLRYINATRHPTTNQATRPALVSSWAHTTAFAIATVVAGVCVFITLNWVPRPTFCLLDVHSHHHHTQQDQPRNHHLLTSIHLDRHLSLFLLFLALSLSLFHLDQYSSFLIN